MEPGTIVDDLEIEWQSEESLAENMKKIVAEFRKAWNLTPLKIILHGPPASGKTRLAKRIAEHYGVRYINVKTVIEESIAAIQEKIDYKKAKMQAAEEKQRLLEEAGDEEAEEEAEEEEEDEDEGGDIEEWQDEIQDIQNTMNESEDGKLPDAYVIRLLKAILISNQSQNQGFVIDGYPKTLQQARTLFSGGGEEGEEEEPEEEEEGGAGGTPAGKLILPDLVISLEATDDFLCERIMKQPESEIQGTHYTEENMLRRLAAFRFLNTEDNTMLNYFDEIEIHPVLINIMDDRRDDMGETMDTIKNIIGKPIGFGLTPEEEAELKRLEDERLANAAEIEKRKQQEMESIAMADHRNKMEKWAELLEQYQQEEENLLIAQSEPLRHYLMRYVFPTLTAGLLQVARLKPSDPVDFLAEYLFKENPEGKMFDPSYTKTVQMLEEKYKRRSSTIAQ